jgi:hypothetical protein
VTDEKSLIRKWLEEAKRYYAELGGWKTIKSGEWLWFIIERSFKNYWERATAEYFHAKYPNLDVDKIAKKLIVVAAKNAAILGGTIGATVSTDEIVGLLTGFEGGVGLPANIAIAGASLSAEAIQLVRIQLQLVANLGKLYGAPLDPDDPEDILTILAFALGGAVADAAGKAGLRLECWEGAPRLVGCRVVCAIPTPSRVMAFRPVLLDRYGRQSGPGGRRIGGLLENPARRSASWSCQNPIT